MKVCVVGTGYVGLVTGLCFADMGNHVTCVDVDVEKLDKLRRGEPVIFEPGLSELLERNLKEKRITFTTDLAGSVNAARVSFIAVGTPEGEDGSADLKHVLAVARSIGLSMESPKLVVVKSTVPVGTCERVEKEIHKALNERKSNLSYDVASNPEFLKEGSAVSDFMKPDRIVIGVKSKEAEDTLKELYSPFLRTAHPVITMDVRSSEMTKYASNAMLATKISFINEIANICDKLGADVGAVRIGMGSDSRIGHQFLFPGIGYGGSCFPKDVQALVHTARSVGYEPTVLGAVDSLNERQKGTPARSALEWFEEEGVNPATAKVAVWGIAFKPNTDDIREAPALVNMTILLDEGVTISAYDPVAMENAAKQFTEGNGRVSYGEDAYEVLKDADALIICTEWGQFRRPDFEQMKALMKRPAVFDGRNLFEPSKMRDLGFFYRCIGRSV